ncbi:MAG TPA: RNA polymerase sigma factor [Kofleriaceae bacterium]|nr:RNA polymerase sigma factor [Kofleriaceae bacterium]
MADHHDEVRDALARGDDDLAFALVTREHGRAIYTRCLDVLRDPGLAEDALQETLVKAFRRRDQLASVARLRGWLLRIATRTALDAWRGERRHARRLERMRHDGDDGDEAASMMPIATADDRRREHAALRAALGELDAETRAAVLLRLQDDAAWEEIAAATGLPVDTIRMRVQRALPGLQAFLARQGVEP